MKVHSDNVMLNLLVWQAKAFFSSDVWGYSLGTKACQGRLDSEAMETRQNGIAKMTVIHQLNNKSANQNNEKLKFNQEK